MKALIAAVLALALVGSGCIVVRNRPRGGRYKHATASAASQAQPAPARPSAR
jgi:hypothetical protein